MRKFAKKLHMTSRIVTLLIWLVGASTLFAQSDIDKHAFAAKVLAIDYGTPNDADLDITFGLELGYRYLINRNIGLALPLKIGVADVQEDLQNRNVTSLDLVFQLFPLGIDHKVSPYVMAGAGYVVENLETGNGQFPIGGGLNFMVGTNSYVTAQAEYRSSTADFRDNLQLGLGYLVRFGRSDQDNDGVADSEDECPTEVGPAASNGCPDSDNDGIANSVDACPTEAGPASANGCPDSDGDGIVDSADSCPEMAGSADLNGCPDTDEDGVADVNDLCPEVAGNQAMGGCPDSDGDTVHDGVDECPTEAGLVTNNGCPGNDRDNDGVMDEVDQCPDVVGDIATAGCPDSDGDGVANRDDRCPNKAGPYAGCPDTDGDGVIDADDRCPEEVGLTTNKGCPEIEEEVKDVLALAMRAVQFETGSAELLTSSNTVLDQIADILNRYPAYQLRIAGHTDNVGDDGRNQELSEARAAACYEYLLSKGAKSSRITYAGFGEDYPIAPNSSSSGRSLNRRVEFELIIQ